jgi:drug/metabolite transporter (DMT)-like permease
MQQTTRATVGILVATFIWGFGFIATKWALVGLSPHWLNVLRMGTAGVLGVAVCTLMPRLRSHVTLAQFRRAALPGFLLAVLFSFQTLGLTLTTVANSSFLTTLYVIFCPVFAAIFLRTTISFSQWFAVAMALIGTVLLCNYRGGVPNEGDAWTILAAICAAIHFLVIEKLLPKISQPFVFNVFQTIWAGVFCLVTALVLEPWPTVSLHGEPLMLFAFGVLFLVVPASLIAFAIQIWAQAYLPAVTVSLLCLMESPIATTIGAWLFHEQMNATQMSGALAIVMAAALMIVSTWRANRSPVAKLMVESPHFNQERDS